jgi:uncharacterized membrane protein
VHRSLTGRIQLGVFAVVVAATVVGIAYYWPDRQSFARPDQLATLKTESAEVIGVLQQRCRAPGTKGCLRVRIRLLSGPDKHLITGFTVGDVVGDPRFSVGDRVRVIKTGAPVSTDFGAPKIDPYAFSDFERRSPLIWLAAAFCVLVLLTSRLQGLRALVGLAASLAIVLFFIVPAILAGGPPLEVALFGSLAIMLATIPLAHGFGSKTVAACLGTTASLLITLGLADAFTDLAHLTGLSSDEAIYLRSIGENVSLTGLLLAGMVIGALGVLDDLTVSQASTVMALRRANPALRFRPLFKQALSVGHDHIAATVNTLVLAYAGASLPVLLIFKLGATPFGDAINNEAVATQIVATLVGSIGLIAAVPITTALAALFATRFDEHAAVGREPVHLHVH